MNFLTHRFLPVAAALCAMLFAIALSVTVTLNFKTLYYHDMKEQRLSERYGYSEEEIRLNYDVLIDYNSLHNKEEWLTFPTLPQSKEAMIHFKEVKEIFVLFEKMGIVTGILTAIYLLGCAIRRSRLAGMMLKLTGIFSVVIPAIVGAAIALNWEWAFVTFHEIAFDNDFWIFDWQTDPIILLLPDSFFMHCAIMIIVFVFAIAGLAYLIGRRILKSR